VGGETQVNALLSRPVKETYLWMLLLFWIFGQPPLRAWLVRAYQLYRAEQVCREHYFDRAIFGGTVQCEIRYVNARGIVQIIDIPVTDAREFELEAFNIRQGREQGAQL
jgi:hypothetical protein